MKIIVDCYGGDYSPDEVIKGIIKALREDEKLSIIAVGKREVLSAQFANIDRIEILDAQDVITNDDTPTTAIRNKKDSTLVVALQRLKSDDDIGGLVSAGSTGAVLTGAFMILGRIKGISRPALAPILPTVSDGGVVLIDCGANVDCKSQNMLHFAIMGSAFSNIMLGIDNPRVALLSNGVEEKKGNELNRQSFDSLKDSNINFVGNMEARDLISGEYDVVVADGFNGNIALKASEGIAKSMMGMIKKLIDEGGLKTKIGALLMKPALLALKDKMDYNKKGGAAFLGIEKVIIKSHGSSKEESICASIHQAKQLAEGKIIEKIKESLRNINAK